MTLPGQRIQAERYQVIPRTLIFLLSDKDILLVRVASDRGAWAGQYNGVGGHIEAHENPHSAALREIHEETGLTPQDLQLCGIIHVSPGPSPGISLHVFVGTADKRQMSTSNEGQPEWIPLSNLGQVPVVADLPFIIPRALEAYRQKQPFCGLTTFDKNGQPHIQFHP